MNGSLECLLKNFTIIGLVDFTELPRGVDDAYVSLLENGHYEDCLDPGCIADDDDEWTNRPQFVLGER